MPDAPAPPAVRLGAGPLRLVLHGAAVEVLRPGERRLPGETLARLGRWILTVTVAVANLAGACAVVGLALFVVPMPHVAHAGHVKLINGMLAAAYVAIAVPLGAALGTRKMRRLRRWLTEERPAEPAEKRLVLLAPARLLLLQVSLWAAAALGFGALDFTYAPALGIRVAAIVLVSGAVTASCAYLITEILLRPVAARALQDGRPEAVWVPGVATRVILAWLLGTALPLAGLVAIGVLALAGDRSATTRQLGVAMVVLGAAGIVVGLLVVTGVARATADPVASVRRALSRVRAGEFDVRVPVYDGTQIGQLQMGFNEMVAGLAERERIRETFGTYVDPAVAEHVLQEGTNLAGERVEVTIMFLDVRSFTSFAERKPPEEVLAALNRLFECAVQIIHNHGGRVDKFVGDGLLAVFGAPRRQPGHALEAVRCAQDIARTVAEDDLLEVGIGLNSGEVVAGNVGGAGRLEFTVIGDAVNVAARVEGATRQTGDEILITERTRELLPEDGAPELERREDVELRGRDERLAVYAVRPRKEQPESR